MQKLSFIRLLEYISSPGPRYLLRLNLLLSTFSSEILRANRVLEIGPGFGDLIAYLNSIDPNKTIDAVEVSNDAYRLCSDRFLDNKNISVVHSKVEDFQMEKLYDLLLAFEVLEHIDEDVTFLKEMNSKMKDQGLILLSVPAYMKRWQTQDEVSGHVRRYEEGELISKLELSGFKVMKVLDYGFPLTSLMVPFRNVFYRKNALSAQENTEKSGVENRLFSRRMTYFVAISLFPFYCLQKVFSRLKKGDGFVVLAKKQN